MESLELQESSGCESDSVTVYDGRAENSSVLATYCSADTSLVTSTASSVLVVFLSDQSANAGGFKLNWAFDRGQG